MIQNFKQISLCIAKMVTGRLKMLLTLLVFSLGAVGFAQEISIEPVGTINSNGYNADDVVTLRATCTGTTGEFTLKISESPQENPDNDNILKFINSQLFVVSNGQDIPLNNNEIPVTVQGVAAATVTVALHGQPPVGCSFNPVKTSVSFNRNASAPAQQTISLAAVQPINPNGYAPGSFVAFKIDCTENTATDTFLLKISETPFENADNDIIFKFNENKELVSVASNTSIPNNTIFVGVQGSQAATVTVALHGQPPAGCVFDQTKNTVSFSRVIQPLPQNQVSIVNLQELSGQYLSGSTARIEVAISDSSLDHFPFTVTVRGNEKQNNNTAPDVYEYYFSNGLLFRVYDNGTNERVYNNIIPVTVTGIAEGNVTVNFTSDNPNMVVPPPLELHRIVPTVTISSEMLSTEGYYIGQDIPIAVKINIPQVVRNIDGTIYWALNLNAFRVSIGNTHVECNYIQGVLNTQINGIMQARQTNSFTVRFPNDQTADASVMCDAGISGVNVVLSQPQINVVYRDRSAPIYVTVNGGGSGESFANPTTLQNALTMVAVDVARPVYVAGGNYQLNQSLFIPRGVKVYGGYAANGTRVRKIANGGATNRSGLNICGFSSETVFFSNLDVGVTFEEGDNVTQSVLSGVRIKIENQLRTLIGVSLASNVKLESCIIEGCQIALTTPAAQTLSNVLIDGCYIVDNTGTDINGVPSNTININSDATCVIRNSVIAFNASTQGCIINMTLGNIINCTIASNRPSPAQALGGTMSARTGAVCTNTVFYSNGSFTFCTPQLQVNNCYVDPAAIAMNNAIIPGGIIRLDMSGDAPTIFNNATDDKNSFDYRLARNSELINAGTSIDHLPQAGTMKCDITANPLFRRSSGMAIDVGAYEMQIPERAVTLGGRVYVQSKVSGTWTATIGDERIVGNAGVSACNGSSWATALPAIRFNEVLADPTVYEVWTTVGEYGCGVRGNNPRPVELTMSKIFCGMFVGGETYRDDRENTQDNTFFRPLDGRMTASVFQTSANLTFDGILFTRVLASASDQTFTPCVGKGGLLNILNGNVNFEGCLFTRSRAVDGGAIFIADGNITFDTVEFSNLIADQDGGAICSTGGTVKMDWVFLLEDCQAGINGGAFSFTGASSLDFRGAFVAANHALQGSGGTIYATGTSRINLSDIWADGGDVLLAENGGFIAVDGASSLTISNSSFESYRARRNGGVIYSNSLSPSLISETSFDYNFAIGNGGAICNNSTVDITLKNMRNMSGNKTMNALQNELPGGDGGFLYSNGGVIMEGGANTIIEKNTASNGGGIYAKGKVKILTIKLSENEAKAGIGGAFAHSGGTDINIDDVTASNNKASDNGGAFAITDAASNAVFTNTNILSNVSAAMGGGLFVAGSAVVDGVTFTKNTAATGGGIGSTTQTPLEIKNTTFTENKSTGTQTLGGGAVYQAVSVLNIDKVSFSKNESNTNGGAIYAVENILAKEVSFKENTATLNGGAIYATVGATLEKIIEASSNKATGSGGFIAQASTSTIPIIIDTLRIIGNTAGANGGALSVAQLKGTALAFMNNTAGANGGAVYVKGNGAEMNVTGTRFVNNMATQAGGAIYADATGELKNCLIAFNSANSAAASYVADGGLKFNYCTIVLNALLNTTTLTVPSAMIFAAPSGTPVTNSIIWGNTVRGLDVHELQMTPHTMKYCAVRTSNKTTITTEPSVIAMSSDNLEASRDKGVYGPHFMMTKVPFTLNGYDPLRIARVNDMATLSLEYDSESLCVNRANPADVPNLLGTVDINGNTRVRKALADIGAFESDRNGFCIIEIEPAFGYYGDNHAPVFKANTAFPAEGFKEISTYTVSSPTGAVVTLSSTSDAGTYKVSPDLQQNWDYDRIYLEYIIKKKAPTFEVLAKIEGVPFDYNKLPQDPITVGEFVDFDFNKISSGPVSVSYKNMTQDIGQGLSWRSDVRDIGVNTYQFELKEDKNYQGAVRTVVVSASDSNLGYVLIFNGENLGLVYPNIDTSLFFEEATAGRALWSCPNNALTLTKEQVQSNPLRFKMPKKRTVLNAISRDRYVALVATGSGSGNSPMNKADSAKIDEMVRQVAAIQTTGMNYVYVDSGVYLTNNDSPYGFTVLPNVQLQGAGAVGNSATILTGLDTQTIINLQGNIAGIQLKGGANGIEAVGGNSTITTNVDSCVIVGSKIAGFVTKANSKSSVNATMFVSNEGYGAKITDAEATITNSIFANNVSGAVFVESVSVRGKTSFLTHCTIANNGSTPLRARTNFLNVNNSILWDSVNPLTTPTGVISFENSAIKSVTPSEKNILLSDTVTPCFKSPSTVNGLDGAWYTRDWRLEPASVCINRASNNAISGLQYDMVHNKRVSYGFPDLGAHETDTKGVSFAYISPKEATYVASVINLSMKDSISYPGLDVVVTLPENMIDADTYANIEPVGAYWRYASDTVLIKPADIASVSITSEFPGQPATSMADMNISATVLGLPADGEIEGVFDFESFLPNKDSTTTYAEVDSVFEYAFYPKKNYNVKRGTFKVNVIADDYNLEVSSSDIEYGKLLGSRLSYTAYTLDGNNTPIEGELVFADSQKVATQIGVATYIVSFEPKSKYNQKSVNVEIRVTPISLSSNDLLVTDTRYTYGSIDSAKLWRKIAGQSPVLVDSTTYTVTYGRDGESENTLPVHADTYQVVFISSQTSPYTYHVSSDFVVDSAKVSVTALATSTIYGTAPVLDSRITGLIGTDTLQVQLSSTWTSSTGVLDVATISASANSTNDYDVNVAADTVLTILPRQYNANEVKVIAPTDLIYDGQPKVVTITSDSFTITPKDYQIVYDADTMRAGTIHYMVTFKRNFTGAVGDSYIITLPSFNVAFTDTKHRYDGTKKKVSIDVQGEYLEAPVITYTSILDSTRVYDSAGVATAGIYEVKCFIVQKGDDKQSIFRTFMTISEGKSIATFDYPSHVTKVEPSIELPVYLSVSLDIPCARRATVEYKLITTASSESYEMSASSFVFEPGQNYASVVLMLKNDGKRLPAQTFKIELYSQDVEIDELNSTFMLTVTDNGDGSNEVTPTDNKVAFAGEKEVVVTGNTRKGLLAIASQEEGSVYLKFSSIKTGELICNGMAYDPSSGAKVDLRKGETAVPFEFTEARKLKVLNTVTVSLHNIAPASLKLTNIKDDQKRIIYYVDNAPKANTDEMGVAYESLAVDSLVRLYVINNDEPFRFVGSVNTVEESKADLFISAVYPPATTLFQYSIVDQKYILVDMSTCSSALLKKGYTETFEYALSQIDGGEATGVVHLTVGEKEVKGSLIAIPEAKSTYIEYEDVFKKANSQGYRTRTASTKLIRSGVEAYAQITSTILGYSKKLLSESYKSGHFLTDLKSSSDSRFYTKPRTGSPALLQLDLVASTLIDKAAKDFPTDRAITTLNIAPASEVKLGGDTITLECEKNGVVVDSMVVSDVVLNSNGEPCALVTGNYFGAKPKAYLEYRSSNGLIKKIALPTLKSLSVKKNGNTLKWKSSNINFGEMGMGSKIMLKWPKKSKLDNIKHSYNGVRFDLIIDNGSFLTPIKSFEDDSRNIVK